MVLRFKTSSFKNIQPHTFPKSLLFIFGQLTLLGSVISSSQDLLQLVRLDFVFVGRGCGSCQVYQVVSESDFLEFQSQVCLIVDGGDGQQQVVQGLFRRVDLEKPRLFYRDLGHGFLELGIQIVLLVQVGRDKGVDELLVRDVGQYERDVAHVGEITHELGDSSDVFEVWDRRYGGEMNEHKLATGNV